MPTQGVQPLPRPFLGEHGKGILVRAAQLLFQLVGTGALLFLCAGSVAWPRGWLYLAMSFATMVALTVWVLPRNPEVIAARGRLHRETAGYDKVLLPFYTLFAAALFVVGALDNGRFGWAPLSWPWSIAGAVLLVLAMIPVAGAMGVNRNLETTMRIQRDRGHAVATDGPYRVVRHPMYAGSLLHFPAIALVLGSTWALVPAAACLVWVVIRTALEDRALHRDLPGYEAYAQRTRYRLVPGVW